MGRDAKHVLLVITFFPESASKEALGAVSGLTAYYLEKAVVELVELRLLDIKEELVAFSQYYTVHPLTRTFASNQISKELEFAKQARLRWSKYYLDFASRHLVQERPEEHYWKTLIRGNVIILDQEWPNFRNLLVWADQTGQDQLLVELILSLVHYMDTRFLYPERLFYARKAAEAAERSDRKADAAIFYIDALGWTLIEEDRLALLDNGNIEQAESLFNSVLASEHYFVTMEMIYAKYALARIAHIKCEHDKARRLAQEALSDLSRVATSNRLLNQLDDFLKSLKED
jgi:hypothetical protein